MNLDRGVLARLDRKLLAGLGQDETYRMVRVPVTAAKWSTWRRYCGSAGMSMGRAIVALIDRELVSVFGDHAAVFAEQAEEELATRQEQVARQEEKAAVVEERLRAWNAHLRSWEVELEVRERRVEFAAKMAAQPEEVEAKVGRNERCACGSGEGQERALEMLALAASRNPDTGVPDHAQGEPGHATGLERAQEAVSKAAEKVKGYEKDHPGEGNAYGHGRAAEVHAALAAGISPSTLESHGQKVIAMVKAVESLTKEKPGRGLGRNKTDGNDD